MKLLHRQLLLMTLVGSALLISTQLLSATGQPSSNPPIPQEIYGHYAKNGNCAIEPIVETSSKGITVQYQGLANKLPVGDVCYSCAGGAQYNGIQRWVQIKEGKDRWGGTSPVTLMFNANEQKGRLEASDPGALVTPISMPLTAVVKASPLQLCKPGFQAAANQNPEVNTSAASIFAKSLIQLMSPFTISRDSFYDWHYLEKAPDIQWAALPPKMIDKPMSDRFYFQRKGLINLGSQSITIVAGGAREMVMAFYILNQGAPLGESNILSAFKSSGASVTTARCPINANLPAPRWYRITARGKHPAFLWIAPAQGKAQPWEGYQFSLETTLPPMSPDELKVYTEKCPN